MTKIPHNPSAFARYSRRLLVMTMVIVLQLFLTSLPAFAHAELVRVEPDDGTTLESAPQELQLWFSEPVAVKFTSVRLLDENNQQLQGLTIGGDLTEASTIYILLPSLKTGSYTLFWKTMSGSDGHFIQGFSLFGIGKNVATTRPANAAVLPASSLQPSWVEGGLRWANYLLLSGLVGTLAMFYLVLAAIKSQPNTQAMAMQQRLRRRTLGWAASCANGAFWVGCGLLAWQIVIAGESTLAATPWLTQAWLVLTESHWGTLWLVRQGLLLLLSIGLWRLVIRGPESTSTWFHLAVSGRVIDLLIVQALSGHTIASSQNWLLALLNSTVHLLGAGLWMGGTLALILIVMPAMRQNLKEATGWRPMAWKSFSQLAALSVSLLIISGLYSMGRQVASLDALITTPYGQLLLGKIGIVLFTGLCGLINALLFHPNLAAFVARRLGRPQGWTPQAFRKWPHLLALEVVLGVLVFGVTGLLTSTPPPRGVEYTIAPEEIQPLRGQRIDDLFFTLAVTPNRPGKNLLSLRIFREQQSLFEDVPQVKIRIANGSEETPLIPVAADRGDATLYQLKGDYFKQAGRWSIDVVAKRDGKEDVMAHFNWVVAPTGAVQPVVLSKRPLTMPLTVASGLSLLLLLVGLLGWQLRRLLTPALSASKTPELDQSAPNRTFQTQI